MRFVREVGQKGQVVIPADIREMLRLKHGQRIVFEVQDNEVKIRQERSAEQAMSEFLSLPKLKKPITLKELKKIEEESYDLP